MHIWLWALTCIPAYTFERYNGILGAMPNNNKSIEVQLMRRFLRETQSLSAEYPSEFFLPAQMLRLCCWNSIYWILCNYHTIFTKWLDHWDSSWSAQYAKELLPIHSDCSREWKPTESLILSLILLILLCLPYAWSTHTSPCMVSSWAPLEQEQRHHLLLWLNGILICLDLAVWQMKLLLILSIELQESTIIASTPLQFMGRIKHTC